MLGEWLCAGRRLCVVGRLLLWSVVLSGSCGALLRVVVLRHRLVWAGCGLLLVRLVRLCRRGWLLRVWSGGWLCYRSGSGAVTGIVTDCRGIWLLLLLGAVALLELIRRGDRQLATDRCRIAGGGRIRIELARLATRYDFR